MLTWFSDSKGNKVTWSHFSQIQSHKASFYHIKSHFLVFSRDVKLRVSGEVVPSSFLFLDRDWRQWEGRKVTGNSRVHLLQVFWGETQAPPTSSTRGRHLTINIDDKHRKFCTKAAVWDTEMPIISFLIHLSSDCKLKKKRKKEKKEWDRWTESETDEQRDRTNTSGWED